jgi:hypothetical protein
MAKAKATLSPPGPTALPPEVGTLPAPLNAKPPQEGGTRYHSDLMHECGENKLSHCEINHEIVPLGNPGAAA